MRERERESERERDRRRERKKERERLTVGEGKEEKKKLDMYDFVCVWESAMFCFCEMCLVLADDYIKVFAYHSVRICVIFVCVAYITMQF